MPLFQKGTLKLPRTGEIWKNAQGIDCTVWGLAYNEKGRLTVLYKLPTSRSFGDEESLLPELRVEPIQDFLCLEDTPNGLAPRFSLQGTKDVLDQEDFEERPSSKQ